MPMPLLPCLALALLLSAQDRSELPPKAWEPSLDLRTHLSAEPMDAIRLATPGCWDGLVLNAARPKPKRPRRGVPEATVEVWGLALPEESARQQNFRLHLGDLRATLLRALALPPPSHGSIELSEIMLSDPVSPQKLDLTKVRSMQDRFNRLPPNGSRVR